MKIKKLCFLLVCIMLPLCTGVCAESVFETVTTEYDRTSGTVDISGEVAATANSEEPVRLMVLNPGTDIQKLADGEITFAMCGVYADETDISDTRFKFDTFKLADTLPVGDYILRIAADGEIYTDVISVATTAEAIELVCGATSAEDVKEYIEKYGEVYGLENGEDSIFATFDADGRDYVYAALADTDTPTLADVQNAFKVNTLLYKVYAGPWGTLAETLSDNAAELGLDMTEFDKLSQAKKDSVCKSITGKKYKTAESLKTAFDAAVKSNKTTSGSGSSGGSSGSSGKKTSTVGMPSVVSPTVPTTPVVEQSIFGDLGNVEWAKESIELLYKKGIVNGKADGIFAPDDMLTRAEAVKMIVLALFETNGSAECEFTDVPQGSWMYEYMAAATEKGIVKGMGDGSVGAEDNITREDFAVMIYRAAKAAGIEFAADTAVYFADSGDISDYAKDAVETLAAAKIINGMGNDMFMPKNNATRAQAAKIVAGLQ